MTQSGGGGGGGGGGAEFHLPDEILAVMPTDPYEQLDLARKITSMAIASRVSKLEIEASRMRQRVAEKDLLIAELQEKLSQRDQMFREADARLRTALEENIKLSKERDSLSQTSKKLARDLAKLETFKRHLMLSLNDDGSSQQETVDIRTCDQSVAKVSAWKDGGSISHPASNLSTDAGNMTQEATRLTGQKFSITPHITPRLTPTATPKITSTCGSPRGYGGSPKLTSGASSPTKPRFDGHVAMSPWFPSSKQTSAANSPPRGRLMPGRTPRIDGKEFFRQARSRLSYEQFAAFLANIKELNAHRQSREETLKKAEEIFGSDNKDLYLSFQGLLNRSLP
ncbi:uncharacterized protein At4g15545-like [Ananas comosus]|uniref:Uncharacterized protein At4g15545-like n=2 Tax=Ananas comosus TaxID=4615 RepID=A0A6P5F5S5_ANACO|nr:uncharacterized protein At4g15545-like [Ananas comosus]CAD1841460.1 unnamed protein product [Ananas comosus var. bracteatus]